MCHVWVAASSTKNASVGPTGWYSSTRAARIARPRPLTPAGVDPPVSAILRPPAGEPGAGAGGRVVNAAGTPRARYARGGAVGAACDPGTSSLIMIHSGQYGQNLEFSGQKAH